MAECAACGTHIRNGQKTCSHACRRAMVAANIPVRFWAKVLKGDVGACWLWTAGRDRQGYGTYTAKHGSSPEHAHRIAWRLVHGAIPEGLFVLHRCDNPPCCNPGHLFLGTPQDNMDDMVAKGRARPVHGEQHVRAKLTAAQVIEIRAAVAAGERQSVLAARMGVDPSSISNLVRRRNWSSVP